MRDVGFCDILSEVRVIRQLKPNSNTLKETVQPQNETFIFRGRGKYLFFFYLRMKMLLFKLSYIHSPNIQTVKISQHACLMSTISKFKKKKEVRCPPHTNSTQKQKHDFELVPQVTTATAMCWFLVSLRHLLHCFTPRCYYCYRKYRFKCTVTTN